MPRDSWLPALPGRKGKLGNALLIEAFLPGVTEISRGKGGLGPQGVGSWSHLGVEGQTAPSAPALAMAQAALGVLPHPPLCWWRRAFTRQGDESCPAGAW